MYDYLLELEFAVCCYYTGHHAEAISVNQRLLKREVLPPALCEQVVKNHQFSVDAMVAIGQSVHDNLVHPSRSEPVTLSLSAS